MDASRKIIAFDLDGTLTESKQKLRYDMAELILRLLEHVKVVIITGGSYSQFKKQCVSSLLEVIHIKSVDKDEAAKAILFASLRNLFLLPTDGSQRYQFDDATQGWKLAYSVEFPQEMKAKAFQLFEEIKKFPEYDIPTETIGVQVEDRGTQITFSALGQEAPLDKKKLWDPDQAKRKKIKAFLEPLLPDISISIGGTTSLDIVPKGFSKAVGLNSLLSALHATIDQTVFIGDALFPGGNDYSVHEAGFMTMKVNGPTDTAVLIKDWLIK